jgi:hypothetical protein
MEPRLIVETHARSTDERHVPDGFGVEAQVCGELRLLLERLRLLTVGASTRRVPIPADPFEVTLNIVLANDRVDLRDRGQARIPDCLRVCLPERARQLIESRVSDHRDVRGGVARVDHRAAIAFDHRDGLPRRGREVSGGQPGDTATNHDNVDGEIAVELRERSE